MKSRLARSYGFLLALTSAAAVCMIWMSGHYANLGVLQQQQQQQENAAYASSVEDPHVPIALSSTLLLSVPAKSNWAAAANTFTAGDRLIHTSTHAAYSSTLARNHIYAAYNPHPNDGRPAMDEVLNQQGEIIGDPQSLLDIAIVGFGKAGTTTVMEWLQKHPRVSMYPKEVYHLGDKHLAKFVKKLYIIRSGNDRIRGYKSPSDLTLPHVAQDYLRKYWPKTRLIVGIRHPVRWFESLYNFRIQNLPKTFDLSTFPTTDLLIGPCREYSQNVCTAKGEFALHLFNLGKTLGEARNVTRVEKTLYKLAKRRVPELQYLPNPVFLYDTSQLADANETRAAAFRRDLSTFIGLPMNDALSTEIPHHRPGKLRSKRHQDDLDAFKIDICSDLHVLVRRDLMRIARTSSLWIRRYLLSLKDPTVVVSSPEYFDTLMEGWMDDPCGGNGTNGAGVRILQVFAKAEQQGTAVSSTV